VAGPDVRIITDDGELIRALTLDPTRSYQPLGGRWPVHYVLQQTGHWRVTVGAIRTACLGLTPDVRGMLDQLGN
jgi:hypothetical protein